MNIHEVATQQAIEIWTKIETAGLTEDIRMLYKTAYRAGFADGVKDGFERGVVAACGEVPES